MLVLVIVVGVAAAFLLRAQRPAEHEAEHGSAEKEPSPTPEQGSGLGGGVDWKAVGGLAGTAASLGGTIVAALGGGTAAGGAAAAGGTAAAGGGIASGGSIVTGSAGATAGGGAAAGGGTAAASGIAAGASGVSTGLSAAFATSPVVLAVVFIIAWVIVDNEAAASRTFWNNLSANKRRLYFQRWFLFEEKAVQAYLEQLGAARGAPVAHTKRAVNVIEDADIGGTAVYGYVVDSVSDPEAAAALPLVRTIARWFAIARYDAYNLATGNYWASLNDAPTPATQQPYGWNQWGNNPGMRHEDYWRLVADYLREQPFAAVRQDSAAASTGGTGPSIGGGAASAYAPTESAMGWSYQPYGRLQQTDWAALAARAGQLLGGQYGRAYLESQIIGYASGGTIASMKDYQLFFPGEGEFTRAVVERCGIPWPVSSVRTAANEIRTCAREQQTGAAWDVVGSRNNGRPIIYRNEDLQ